MMTMNFVDPNTDRKNEEEKNLRKNPVYISMHLESHGCELSRLHLSNSFARKPWPSGRGCRARLPIRSRATRETRPFATANKDSFTVADARQIDTETSQDSICEPKPAHHFRIHCKRRTPIHSANPVVLLWRQERPSIQSQRAHAASDPQIQHQRAENVLLREVEACRH